MVKTEEGEMETAAVAELLSEAVSLFKSEAIIRDVEVDVDVAPSLPSVRVNRVQIQQVMINLMMNAAEAMETEATPHRRLIIRVCELEGSIQAAFRDFGKGIDIPETNKLFEPFFTTKTTGLGMGLSLSRSIMESHGGHIWAENNPDKGATFYFDLPAISK
jgi:two-component system sensor kinase FixL